MKAEQRKELETNTLADKMGRAVQRVKTRPRRTFLIYLIVTVVLIVGLFITYRWWVNKRLDNSERWVKFYDGSRRDIDYLSEKDPETYAGKAARFQIAWMYYWEIGMKKIGTNNPPQHTAKTSVEVFSQVGRLYAKLAEDCKGDKIFEPQALLGRAVCEESMAVESPAHLETANEYYEEVVSKYPESAQGKFAQGRLDILKDKNKRAELKQVYGDLQAALHVPAPQADNLQAAPPDDDVHNKIKQPAKKK